MSAIPEFILRKLFVQNSLKNTPDGLHFNLNNTFAPATILAFTLEVDGQPVPLEDMTLQVEEDSPQKANGFSTATPFILPVDRVIHVTVHGLNSKEGSLRFRVNTREVGEMSFSIKAGAGEHTYSGRITGFRKRSFFSLPYPAEWEVRSSDVRGDADPYIYGHFVEHLERCVYGGVWSDDGTRLRPDTLELVNALKPPLIRYPGGNFASGYHWEDGIGPRGQRPVRFDAAWNSQETNQVGTDEFMEFCRQVSAAAYLNVNDATGTPEEAARWVAYCNESSNGKQGRRRLENGHPEPYNVSIWGLGNEVWGEWQIGHTDAKGYVKRGKPFIKAMRAVDPGIRIVGVGDGVLSDAPDDHGRQWNEVVLRGLGEELDYLSFHVYHPEHEGWRENYDPESLYHTVCAAPLAAEAMINRMAAQIKTLVPGRQIGIALDEWNIFLPPESSAMSMHQQQYTMRDCIYAAGMLNAFLRQCNSLKMANLAQLVNVLPLIVTDETRAYATPLYYAFLLYKHMERSVLKTSALCPTFDSQELGNIAAQHGVPYLDMAATYNETTNRLVLAFVNRHPTRGARLAAGLRGFGELIPVQGWTVRAPHPLAKNDFQKPDRVGLHRLPLPTMRGDRLRMQLPPASVSIAIFR